MIRRIRVDALRPGMYLHGLCGSWFDHGLWGTRFLLRDDADLRRLRDCGAAECLIDTARGLDLDTPADEGPPAGQPVPSPAAPPAATETLPARVALEDEAARAAALCAQARRRVALLHDDVRLGRALSVDGCAPLVDEIAASIERSRGAMLGMVRLKAHDDYTFMHSVAVAALMMVLARRLGHDADQVREAGLAGLLHDLGKAAVPLALLNKPGRLAAAEYETLKQHPRLGHELLRASGQASALALDVCLHHHERPDGRGYPDRLQGEALSTHARMGAVCDVYDAISSQRAYKAAWSPAESIARMAEWTRAGQFDAAVFRAFVDCVGIYPVGSLVRLKSQRLAVVVEHQEHAPLAPRVKVFYSIRAQLTTPPELLDLAAPGCADPIVARESNSAWRFGFLDALAAPDAAVRRAA